MPIFNKEATLSAINEMKTREEYARRRFKKKYNFEPDKPGSSKGTITDKAGKKYHVDTRPDKDINTRAVTHSKDSHIDLDKNYFKIKGSHKGERRDAILQHEIGHQNLHNWNYENKTVDNKNRSEAVFKRSVDKAVKNSTGKDFNSDEDIYDIAHSMYKNSDASIHGYFDSLSPSKLREVIYKQGFGAEKYKATIGSKEDEKRRDSDYQKAKKFEKGAARHTNANEFEADRFAANRTSERAIKKGLSNSYRISKKNNEKAVRKEKARDKSWAYNNFDKDTAKHYSKSRSKKLDADLKNYKKDVEIDKQQRAKVLKDPDMRRAETYK